jgi:hypothetical protein
MPLPAIALLSNRGTWAVPTCCLPAGTAALLGTPGPSYEKCVLGFPRSFHQPV